eukprot:SAG31_NODE_4087_length_3601_cov_3.169903_5_plen_379_part_01
MPVPITAEFLGPRNSKPLRHAEREALGDIPANVVIGTKFADAPVDLPQGSSMASRDPVVDTGMGGKRSYFLVFAQLFERYGTLVERNTALIEEVSALIVFFRPADGMGAPRNAAGNSTSGEDVQAAALQQGELAQQAPTRLRPGILHIVILYIVILYIVILHIVILHIVILHIVTEMYRVLDRATVRTALDLESPILTALEPGEHVVVNHRDALPSGQVRLQLLDGGWASLVGSQGRLLFERLQLSSDSSSDDDTSSEASSPGTEKLADTNERTLASAERSPAFSNNPLAQRANSNTHMERADEDGSAGGGAELKVQRPAVPPPTASKPKGFGRLRRRSSVSEDASTVAASIGGQHLYEVRRGKEKLQLCVGQMGLQLF